MAILKLALTVVYAIPLLSISQPGIDEFYEVSEKINRWYFSLSDLILVVGGISGLLGGVRVYANWQAGKSRIDTEVSGWFFACLFLSLVGAALKALYNVS